jgi:hypothetical protein
LCYIAYIGNFLTFHTEYRKPDMVYRTPQERPVALAVRDLPRATQYAVLRARHPRWSASRVAQAAGYRQRDGRGIERTAAAQLAQQSIEQQRLLWQANPDASLSGVVARQVAIACDHSAEDRDRLKADDQTAGILGYNAPQRVQVTGAFLVRELSGLTPAELSALREVTP